MSLAGLALMVLAVFVVWIAGAEPGERTLRGWLFRQFGGER